MEDVDAPDPEAPQPINSSFQDVLQLYDEMSVSSSDNFVIMLVYVPVFLVAFFGNLVVLLVILTDARMRKSAANYFLVNLAVTDLLVAIICVPMTSINYVYNVWILGTTVCKLTSYMQGVCLVASILTIVLMSLDRYFAIRHPMRNRQIFTVSRVRRLIVMTWVTGAVVAMPVALVNQVISHEHFNNNVYCTESWPSPELRQVYDIAIVVCIYLVPGGALGVLYTLIGVRLWARDSNLQRQNSMNNQDDVLIARRRLALMMIIVSVLFAASWLPYHILTICLDFEVTGSLDLISLYPVALLLGHSNSAQNPILYCFMHKGFKTFLLRMVKCQCPKLRSRKQRNVNLSISRSENSSTKSPCYKMIGRKVTEVEGNKVSDVITCKGESRAMLGADV
ncbi:gastrin/cholecystokinin type B receptor-like [Physella acuta]|uniref:gastrin/cholecystokinin type B receptor-like n=1 Tax=Physella acuta TaxID=109671 RepID=UPI0027DB11D2|nr:gastrin/cholecystokinin type B receptor-like [Physella acuta]